jgi:hypothetical protein
MTNYTPAQKMETVENFCRFIQMEMKEKGLFLGLRDKIISICSDKTQGCELTLDEIMTNDVSLIMLLNFVPSLYNNAKEEYEDDAAR